MGSVAHVRCMSHSTGTCRSRDWTAVSAGSAQTFVRTSEKVSMSNMLLARCASPPDVLASSTRLERLSIAVSQPQLKFSCEFELLRSAAAVSQPHLPRAVKPKGGAVEPARAIDCP
eukprot:SAG31_NODE_23963_length_492_cov_0.890585_1_plen_115_part_10